MITAPIWLAIDPLDMRIGIEGLCGRIVQSLGKSSSDGSAYVFRNRRGTRNKVLMWDHTGVCGCASAVCTRAALSGRRAGKTAYLAQ